MVFPEPVSPATTTSTQSHKQTVWSKLQPGEQLGHLGKERAPGRQRSGVSQPASAAGRAARLPCKSARSSISCEIRRPVCRPGTLARQPEALHLRFLLDSMRICATWLMDFCSNSVAGDMATARCAYLRRPRPHKFSAPRSSHSFQVHQRRRNVLQTRTLLVHLAHLPHVRGLQREWQRCKVDPTSSPPVSLAQSRSDQHIGPASWTPLAPSYPPNLQFSPKPPRFHKS